MPAAVLLACVVCSGCSRGSAPPTPHQLEATTSVPSARPLSPSAPSATAASPPAGAPRVETTVSSDDPDAECAARTYETWLTKGSTKQLLATNGITGGSVAPNDLPAKAQIVGQNIHYVFDGMGCTSSWVGTQTADFTVSPLALVSEELLSWHRMFGCSVRREDWNWRSFTGSASWDCEYGPKCPTDQPGPSATPDCWSRTRCKTHEYLPIPDVTLPDGYAGDAGGDWACHTIKGCSVVVDGTKGHGFVTFGKRLAGDPAFLAVASGRWLFVQLDGEQGEAGSDVGWVGEDHLEVWVAEDQPFPCGGECPEHTPVQQWGVRISDARVFPGAGKPQTLLRAERAACAPHTIEMRIELPEKHGALTVAYSAGTAHKQRMVTATSPLVYADATSLGSVKRIDPKRAVCKLAGAALVPVMTRVASDKPLATFD